MTLTPKIYAHALWETLEMVPEGKQREVVKRLAKHLARAHRTKWVPAIVRELERIGMSAHGVATVELATARPAPREATSDLKKRTRALEVAPHIDPSLLGGAVVRRGDRRVDLSLRRILANLKEQLQG